MDVMLLHLDEELTNNRPGHSYETRYAAADLAFWVQFYSLFYDRVLVPANFLSDSNRIPDVLKILQVDQPSSVLRLEDSPLQILWDEERFPFDRFGYLIDAIEAGAGEASDASLRNINDSRQTAALCDTYLAHKIIRRSLSTRVHNDASVRLLKETVFSSNLNSALESSDCNFLSECLEQIAEEGGSIGYGRNFFYAIFGYGTTPADLEIAHRFSSISRLIDEKRRMRHIFLTGVDYASNTIKAVVASQGLQAEVDALLPSEYQRIFRRPHTETLWHADDQGGDAPEVPVAAKHRYLLDRDTIIRMTADQFLTIRAGGEYDSFRKALKTFSSADSAYHQQKARELTDALNGYLEKIESVLNPGRFYVDRAFEIAGKVRLSDQGFCILCAIGIAGTLVAPESTAKALLQRGIELLTVHYNVGVGIEAIRKKTTRRKEFPTEGFQLGRDVKVSLIKTDH